MKTRIGFVSNSSSSSIIVKREYLNEHIINKIEKHSEIGQLLNLEYADQNWSVHYVGEGIELRTSMDNFDMLEYFKTVGIPEEAYYINYDG